MRHRPVSAALGIAAVAAVIASCGRSVTVQPLPIHSPASAQACAALIESLPQQISAGRSWAVEPDPHSTKAYGTPAVVLRCGDEVPQPEPTDQVLAVDGLDWLVTELSDGEQYTTIGTSPGVVVTVPQRYAPTASVLAELNPHVDDATTG